MKLRIAIVLFLSLFSICDSSIAAYYAGSSFCSFNGILDPSTRTREEEFNMLLEPVGNPNYEAVSSAVGALTVVTINDLLNQNCNVLTYAKDLIKFYKNNEDKIYKKDKELAELLSFIEKRINSGKSSSP
jgi:hypothetical protein